MQHGSRRYAERIEQNIINIENADMGKLLHGFKQYYHAYKYCGRYGKVMFHGSNSASGENSSALPNMLAKK